MKRQINEITIEGDEYRITVANEHLPNGFYCQSFSNETTVEEMIFALKQKGFPTGDYLIKYYQGEVIQEATPSVMSDIKIKRTGESLRTINFHDISMFYDIERSFFDRISNDYISYKLYIMNINEEITLVDFLTLCAAEVEDVKNIGFSIVKTLETFNVLDEQLFYYDRKTKEKIVCRRQVKNGMPHGYEYYYTPDGLIMNRESFVNGVKSSLQYSYWSNGNLKSIVHMKNGLHDGDIVEYETDGITIERQCTCLNGTRINDWVYPEIAKEINRKNYLEQR